MEHGTESQTVQALHNTESGLERQVDSFLADCFMCDY